MTEATADNLCMRGSGAQGAGGRAAHADQRRHGRVRARGVTSSLGEVLDLSASGMRVQIQGKPPCDIGQRITVMLEGDGRSFLVALRPVWLRGTGWRTREMGCCFEDVDEDTRVQLIALMRASVRNLTSEQG